MSEKLGIFLLDNINNIIEEIEINRPKTFQILLIDIKKNMKKLPIDYILFYTSEKNEKILINDYESYKLLKDILFIRETDKIDSLEQSIYQINYNTLSESKQDILDEKYNCFICSISIKNENPYYCYICQKIFHNKCLKDWDNKKKQQNEILNCPNCRNQLPLDKWKQKLDFKDNRINEANNMEKINQYNLNNNLNININLINEKKINKLKEKNKKQEELIQKYINYIENINKLFKSIFNKLNAFHFLIKSEYNHKLDNINKKFSQNKIILQLQIFSDILLEEFEIIEKYIKNNKSINVINDNKLNNNHNNKKENLSRFNNEIGFIKDEHKKNINLIYISDSNEIQKIFGKKFVENNKDNIDLIINGEKCKLIDKYILKKGENNIEMIIKNKIINLCSMFYECRTLVNIEELKYLDTKEVKNFSEMFYGCSISNINPLEKWDVSNVNNFDLMFFKCNKLSDIKALKTWNVSNCINFSRIFMYCSSLYDISALEKWDVSNGTNLDGIFYGCISLKDIKPLEKWNISNATNLRGIFYGCKSLKDIRPLEKWNVSNCINFVLMFGDCKLLSSISPLKNWNVSKGKEFRKMFNGCSSLLDITALENWDLSNGIDFSNMFKNCHSSLDLKPIKKRIFEKYLY